MNIKNLLTTVAPVGLTIGTLVVSIFAGGRLDTTFNAALIKAPAGFASKTKVQPDGKIITYGTFRSVNGEPAGSNLVRLNADGSTDTSFRAPSFTYGISHAVKGIELQSDGKIIVAGVFDRIGGVSLPQRGIARLNTDGSLDPTFLGDPSIPTILADVYDLLVLPDDRIVVGNVNGFARLLPNGSLDSSFSASHRTTPIVKLALQPDGKILGFSGLLRRFNADGTTDADFTLSTFNSNIYDIKVQSDGKILVGGQFTRVNGSVLPQLARFNSDGSVDATFVNQFENVSAIVHEIIPLADGMTYVLGGSTAVHNGVDVHRLKTDGSIDTSFNGIPSAGWDMDLQPDGRIIVSNDATFNTNFPRLLYRMSADGVVDNTFGTNLGVEAIGQKIFVQPNGKLLVGGAFNFANNVSRLGIARFNPDGTVDTTFNAPSLNPNNNVSAIDMQPDGKIVINARGSSLSPDARRLNSDGSLDVIFQGSAAATDVKVLADGKILISGANYVYRYNSNGTFDATFTTVVDGVVNAMAIQPDGKVLIVGGFMEVNGTPRGRVARLNDNGSLDFTFDTSTGANSDVLDIALQSDGKVVIGGSFSGVNFAARGRIARLNSDGTLDAGFTPSANSRVDTIKIQRDNKILVGGLFIQLGSFLREKIARLNPNGTVDVGFDPKPEYHTLVSGETIRDIEVQADGKILMTSDFMIVDGVPKLAIARLHNSSVPFDYDGDGRADISVYRPSTNRWYELLSSNGTVAEVTFGTAGDIPVPADFDGDGKTDEAIFRPSNSQWWYRSSIDGSYIANTFGENGDIPRPSDFDGDGKADLVLFRPSNSTWYRFGSTAGHVSNTVFGLPGDQPLSGDFDGDGKFDLAVFRPSNGDWWYASSSAGGAFVNVHWGQNGDLPVPADYDGDGKTDHAVYRPSEGGWYVYNSGNGCFTTLAFGTSEDRPVAADYDGDGRADIAVFRPSTGVWYLLRSTSGFAGVQFGISSDTPTPNSFVP
jgi:uncharacterized delta-60 repeat protein